MNLLIDYPWVQRSLIEGSQKIAILEHTIIELKEQSHVQDSTIQELSHSLEQTRHHLQDCVDIYETEMKSQKETLLQHHAVLGQLMRARIRQDLFVDLR